MASTTQPPHTVTEAEPAGNVESHPIRDATQALDPTVHHPVRLGILTVVDVAEKCTFAYLKDALELTDGNLSRNLAVLEKAGFVEIKKGYEGKRPRTWVKATDAGHAALARERDALRALLP